jgi:hypothetical protein
VDDAFFVSELQRVAQVGDDSESFFRSDTSGSDCVSQRDAVDKFHDEVEEFVNLTEVVDGGDVRVIELCQRASLSQEAISESGIALDIARQNFHGDKPVEVWVASFVDSTHSAAADQFQNHQIRKQSIHLVRFRSLETLLLLFGRDLRLFEIGIDH